MIRFLALEKKSVLKQELEKELQDMIADLLHSCVIGELSIVDYIAMRENLLAQHTQPRVNPDQSAPLTRPSQPSAPVSGVKVKMQGTPWTLE